MDKSGIEIGNLEINFSVTNREYGNVSDSGKALSDESYTMLKKNIVNECIKQTLTILREKQER